MILPERTLVNHSPTLGGFQRKCNWSFFNLLLPILPSSTLSSPTLHLKSCFRRWKQSVFDDEPCISADQKSHWKFQPLSAPQRIIQESACLLLKKKSTRFIGCSLYTMIYSKPIVSTFHSGRWWFVWGISWLHKVSCFLKDSIMVPELAFPSTLKSQ